MKTILVGAAALLFTCGPAAAGGVSVQEAWARATSPNAKTGVVYLTLASKDGDTLVGLATPVAQTAELHQSYRTGTVGGMRRVDDLPVPAGKTVKLAPGGYHIMLTGLRQRLVEGNSFPLTLSFAKAGGVQTKVEVEAIGAGGPMPGMGAGHDMAGHDTGGHDMGDMPGMGH